MDCRGGGRWKSGQQWILCPFSGDPIDRRALDSLRELLVVLSPGRSVIGVGYTGTRSDQH
jgi:hypothetical protein